MAIQALINRNIAPQLPRMAAASITRNQTASKVIGMSAPSIVPNFVKRGYDGFIERLAKGIGKVAETKPMRKLTEWCIEHDIDYTNHLSALCANILNGFYMYNVASSKKIEPEQKKPLMLNMFIGTVLSTVGGYALNGAIDKRLKPFDAAIKKQYGENASNILKGFKIAKSLMVFQLLYRFACPVIATPVANYISNKVRDKKAGDKGNLNM